MIANKDFEKCRLKPGTRLHLKDHDPVWVATWAFKAQDKTEAKAMRNRSWRRTSRS